MKRLGFSFRRARRVPPKSPPEQQQARVKRALAKCHRLEAAGNCHVLYGDESGFCLQPPLPYLWQRVGQTVGLPAQAHSRRLNVLGFLRCDGRLYSFPTQETVTAQHLIESVESLLAQLDRPAVLVLDNASVHRAKVVREKRAEWKKRGLRLLFLPPYCPHLNRIETLWRMMKYHWLTPEAYTDFTTLCQNVKDILAQVGAKQGDAKYAISFA